jgi:hypothetical protein
MIYESMQSDQYSHYNQSKRLVNKYKSATPQEKELIDDILITICGYSMPTLIEMAGDYIGSLKHEQN